MTRPCQKKRCKNPSIGGMLGFQGISSPPVSSNVACWRFAHFYIDDKNDELI